MTPNVDAVSNTPSQSNAKALFLLARDLNRNVINIHGAKGINCNITILQPKLLMNIYEQTTLTFHEMV